jgi:hypothetical protein
MIARGFMNPIPYYIPRGFLRPYFPTLPPMTGSFDYKWLRSLYVSHFKIVLSWDDYRVAVPASCLFASIAIIHFEKLVDKQHPYF